MNRRYISLPQVIVEIVGLIALLASFGCAFYVMATTDGQIPTHYAFDGTIDGYGSPATLLIVPGITLVVNIIMFFSAHFSNPAKWNLTFKLKEENAILVYHDLVWMYVLMELELALMSLGMVFAMPRSSGATTMVGLGLVVVIMITAFVPLHIARKHNNL